MFIFYAKHPFNLFLCQKRKRFPKFVSVAKNRDNLLWLELEVKKMLRREREEGGGRERRKAWAGGREPRGKMIFYQQNSRDKFEFISLEMSPSYVKNAWS